MHPLNQPSSTPTPPVPPPAPPESWQSPWALDADQVPTSPPRTHSPEPARIPPQAIRPLSPSPAAIPVPRPKARPAPLPEAALKPSKALGTATQNAMHAQITAAMAAERRRRMNKLLVLCLLVFGLLLLSWPYLQDDNPVRDVDLSPEPPLPSVVPPRAPDRLRLALDACRAVESVDQVGKPAWDWETPLLSRTVQANAAAFDNLRDMLSEDDWQPRNPVWQATDLSSEPQWDALGMAKSAAIAYFSRRGEEQAALQTAMDVATFAKRIQGIYAWPNYYPRGIELHQRACEAIAELLRTTQMSSYQLGQLQFQFERAFPSDAMLHRALKSYYQYERRLIVGLRANDPWDQHVPPLPFNRQSRLFFKPNETLRIFYKAFKGFEAGVLSAPYARIDPLNAIIGQPGQIEGGLYGPNSRGQRYAHKRLWSYSQLVERQGLQSARHLVVLTLFAVRRYERDTGNFPKLLGDLVPGYFTELPNDPYSGKPLCYDPARGLIYSVGTDVQDSGGNLTHIPLSNSKEPTVSVK